MFSAALVESAIDSVTVPRLERMRGTLLGADPWPDQSRALSAPLGFNAKTCADAFLVLRHGDQTELAAVHGAQLATEAQTEEVD